ncbi:reticulon-1-A isoform X1 [Latimeria chalumnae]|uniref:reticulon-1-A isoform X1 n=1 Tax=Latimeria chalumnae TaxID=7897 RepID=UPI0006D90989|nr:PREDICTED: reticulon-1-A-like isoform X1 [Latimeria chalumnae]|eukprot:XP_014349699.1 PREDICTED: reticulon-1-A-like isoform X1 [Latimeria chalumnae]
MLEALVCADPVPSSLFFLYLDSNMEVMAAEPESHLPEAFAHEKFTSIANSSFSPRSSPFWPGEDPQDAGRQVSYWSSPLRSSGRGSHNVDDGGSDTESKTEQHPAALSVLERDLGIKIILADLLYWKDTKTSGVVLTSIMLVLLSLSQFSVIIVSSYLALALLCITITLRVYKKALQALHKSDGANPFQSYLDIDVSLSQEQFQKYTEKILLYFTSLVSELRRLFLVQDLIDSIKFAVLMWLLTYIGAVFNGLTLLILAVVSAFSIPLLYRQHQAQIDQYVGLVSGHISNIRAKIQAKLPSAKPKTQ